jgi:hypothetical protein
MTRGGFDPRLVFALVVLTAPIALFVAAKVFGSLAGFVETLHDEATPPRELAGDVVRHVLLLGLLTRPFQLLRRGRVTNFGVWYFIAMLGVYVVVAKGFPGLAHALVSLAPW